MNKKMILMSIPALMFASVVKVDTTNSNLDLTIYNNGYGMISEDRSVNLTEIGSSRIMYEGIPTSIVMDSVVPTFSKKIDLFSQNYAYDTFSLSSLINKTIGKEISYLNDNTWEKGTLLANNPVLIKTANGLIVTIDKPEKIKFIDIPEEMAIKPSLFWNINSNNKGALDINLKYLTNGLSWSSNYVLNLNKYELSLQGWMSIRNDSGSTYNNASITCLAGEVNKIHNNEAQPRLMKAMAAVAYESDMIVKEEAFSGYHIYKIPFKESIKDRELKQISFIKKDGIKYKTYGYSRINDSLYKFPKQTLSFSNIVEFKNSKKNNLGMPLPAGITRLYKEDSANNSRFIGEQRVSNLMEDEVVKITIGNLFDIKGTEEIISYVDTKSLLSMKTLITLENKGVEEQNIILFKDIPANSKLIDNCADKCKKEKTFDSSEEFTITLKPKESYKLETETLIYR